MTDAQESDEAPHTLAERLLIVPDAHVRVEAIEFQLEMYELFHRTFFGRAGHMLGTPSVLLGIFTGTMLLSPTLGIAVATAVGIGMAVGIAPLDRLASVLSAFATLALVLTAAAVAIHAPAHAPTIALALTFGGCGIQTCSHLFEDIPPPHSRRPRFVAVREWLRGLTPSEALRSAALTVGVFYWLELWASLRILPLQILHAAMHFGWRPELRRRLDTRLTAILTGDDPGWRSASAAHR